MPADIATVDQATKQAEQNATQKIARALRANDPVADPFENVTAEPLPAIGEIESIVKGNIELATSLDTFFGDLESQVTRLRAERAAEITSDMSDLTVNFAGTGSAGPSPKAIDEVTKARQLKLEAEIREARIGLTSAHDATITERVSRLAKAESRLTAFTSTFPQPLSYLMASSLGSAERATYSANLQNAGANELAALAKVAIQTGNRAMGAAIAARVNQLRKDDRPFTAERLADALVGEEYGKYTAAATQLRVLTQSAVNSLRNFRDGRATGKPSHDKILAGLMAQGSQRVQPDGKAIGDLANPRARNDAGQFVAAPTQHTALKGVEKLVERGLYSRDMTRAEAAAKIKELEAEEAAKQTT